MSTPQTPAPLEGVKVIELGGFIAGPYAASLFAQFGADVIKVEPPGEGDPLRRWRKLHNGTSLWWYSLSRNKRSITLNLKSDEGRRILRALVEKADVVVENFRPGTLEAWGLGWDELSRIFPGLILVRISGYGQTGPYRDRPGFGAIAEAIGGLRYVTGYPGQAPVRVGFSLGDTLAALYAVIGALVALHHRNVNGGKGQVVDTALYEAVFAVTESLLPEYSQSGFIRQRSGASLPGISPSNTYTCRDGGYVVIGGNSDGIFKRLARAIGRPDLADDPALAHNDGRVARNDEIDAAISEWTSRHELGDVLAVLERAEVPVGKIYSAADIHSDAHYRHRRMIEAVVLPDGQTIDIPGVVPKLSETPGRTAWIGPALGSHVDEVLASVGLAAAAVKALRRDRVI
jgi:formyl-CoA transferase